MTREAIKAAVDEWVREVAVDRRVGVPDSAGGYEMADYRSHMPTGDPQTRNLFGNPVSRPERPSLSKRQGSHGAAR